jgi:hypothetical protein
MEETPMPLEPRMKFLQACLLAGALALPVLPALAEDAAKPATVRIQGTVEKSDARVLVIHAQDGSSPAFALSPATLIIANAPSSLAAIKAGDFVASAAVMEADGKLHSTELRIFPEALRGLGEGQRPMSAPKTMMTNASVSEVVAAPEGRVLKVKYKDGASELIVGPDVPITALVVSDTTALKPGMKGHDHRRQGG